MPEDSETPRFASRLRTIIEMQRGATTSGTATATAGTTGIPKTSETSESRSGQPESGAGTGSPSNRWKKRKIMTSFLLSRWLASGAGPSQQRQETEEPSSEDSGLEFGTPPPIEEIQCYSMCVCNESTATEEVNGLLQINRETIKSLLVDHLRGTGSRVQLLNDLETNKLDADKLRTGCKIEEINALLLYACFIGRPDLIKLLHECGANLNHCEPEQGMGALDLCAFSNCLEGVEYLMSQNIMVDPKGAYTPFHYAAFGDSVDVGRYLLRRRFCQRSPAGKETVLHAAARTNALNVLRLIGPNNPCLNELDCNGQAAIHYAAERGDSGCLRVLLDAGCDLNLVNGEGKTALHLAAESSCIENVGLLVERGADVHIRNQRGEVPLHVAARSQSLECVELLVKHGGSEANTEDNEGRSPLHLALGKSLAAYEVTEFLIDWGANVNKTDMYGYAPLHVAGLNELSQCVDLLILHGADLSAKTKGGTSALCIILRKTPSSLNSFKQRLTNSITLQQHHSAAGELEMRLDFHPLLSHQQQGEIGYLGSFVKEEYNEVLEHPLCQAFLYLKWQKIKKYYAGRLMFYLLYVVTLTSWVITALAHNCYNESRGYFEQGQKPLCGNGTAIDRFLYERPAMLELEWYALLFFTVLEVLRKLIGLPTYLSVRQFFTQAENMVEWCVILCALATSSIHAGKTYAWQSHVGAIAVLCGWSNLMLMVGQLPIFGAYVAMFTSVQAQVFKLLLAYACLLLGFTASFCVIFPRSKAFSSPHIALIKVLAMMTGELNFDDLFFPRDEHGKVIDLWGSSWILLQLSAQLSFVLFILFVTIVLMNLLVGIAVHDIKGLQKTAGLAKLVRQTKLIYDLETTLFLSIMPKRLMKLLRWSTLVLHSPMRAVLTVRPLNPREERLPPEILRAAYNLVKRNKNPVQTVGSKKNSVLNENQASTNDCRLKEEMAQLRNICETNRRLLEDLLTAMSAQTNGSPLPRENQTPLRP